MNPPYDRNLHLKILAEAITHLKDEKSVCVNLSPVRWLQDPLAKYKKNSDFNRFEESISKHLNTVDIVSAECATKIFNIPFWNDIGIYSINLYVENKWYKEYAKNTLKFWPLVEKIGIPLFQGNLSNVCRVYDKYSKNVSLPYFIKCSRVHGHIGSKDEFDCITPRFDIVFNKKGHEGREVYFNTECEAKNFFKTMNLIFFKFIKSMGCWPTDDFNKGLPWMGDAINPRTGKKGYESEWKDEDFFQFFNITPDEQKIIENTMAKYK